MLVITRATRRRHIVNSLLPPFKHITFNRFIHSAYIHNKLRLLKISSSTTSTSAVSWTLRDQLSHLTPGDYLRIFGRTEKRTLNHDPLRVGLLIHYDRNVSLQRTSNPLLRRNVTLNRCCLFPYKRTFHHSGPHIIHNLNLLSWQLFVLRESSHSFYLVYF
jgi:hypothetical protein